MLRSIGSLWRTELVGKGIANPRLRLAVTSLTRSQEYQAAIVSDERKFASPDSMHCVGAAFDIDASGYYVASEGKLLSVTHPDRDASVVARIGRALGSLSDEPYVLPRAPIEFDERVTDALVTVANRLHESGIISRILEFAGTDNQCVHVTPRPTSSNR